jgi:hypothetical protein
MTPASQRARAIAMKVLELDFSPYEALNTQFQARIDRAAAPITAALRMCIKMGKGVPTAGEGGGMSVERCDRHDLHYDLKLCCPLCEEEEGP